MPVPKSIPLEILEMIASYIDVPTAISLSTVCKSLRDAGECRVWREIICIGGKPDCEIAPGREFIGLEKMYERMRIKLKQRAKGILAALDSYPYRLGCVQELKIRLVDEEDRDADLTRRCEARDGEKDLIEDTARIGNPSGDASTTSRSTDTPLIHHLLLDLIKQVAGRIRRLDIGELFDSATCSTLQPHPDSSFYDPFDVTQHRQLALYFPAKSTWKALQSELARRPRMFPRLDDLAFSVPVDPSDTVTVVLAKLICSSEKVGIAALSMYTPTDLPWEWDGLVELPDVIEREEALEEIRVLHLEGFAAGVTWERSIKAIRTSMTHIERLTIDRCSYQYDNTTMGMPPVDKLREVVSLGGNNLYSVPHNIQKQVDKLACRAKLKYDDRGYPRSDDDDRGFAGYCAFPLLTSLNGGPLGLRSGATMLTAFVGDELPIKDYDQTDVDYYLALAPKTNQPNSAFISQLKNNAKLQSILFLQTPPVPKVHRRTDNGRVPAYSEVFIDPARWESEGHRGIVIREYHCPDGWKPPAGEPAPKEKFNFYHIRVLSHVTVRQDPPYDLFLSTTADRQNWVDYTLYGDRAVPLDVLARLKDQDGNSLEIDNWRPEGKRDLKLSVDSQHVLNSWWWASKKAEREEEAEAVIGGPTGGFVWPIGSGSESSAGSEGSESSEGSAASQASA